MSFLISSQPFYSQFLQSDRPKMKIRKRPTLSFPEPTPEGRRFFAAAVRAARFKMQIELKKTVTSEDLATMMGIPYRSLTSYESPENCRLSEVRTLLYAQPLLFREEGVNCSLDEIWEILIGARIPLNPLTRKPMVAADLVSLGYGEITAVAC